MSRKTFLESHKVIVAASGGVAALKTPSLVRRLQEAGHEVKVVATDDAYHFITKLSLAVAAGSEVFDREAWFKADGRVRHLELANWANILIIAPATADSLARAASGRGDDVISALILAGVPKVIWCPAMNTVMWKNKAVQGNVRKLAKTLGHSFLGPTSGTLATKSEGEGEGRMLEPENIAASLPYVLSKEDLVGKRVLVSAGPTREYLDPVRFISNPSSGKMGFAVAEIAKARGAIVTLVSGPTTLKLPNYVGHIHHIKVENSQEMLEKMELNFPAADVVVMTAAVADWQAAEIKSEKQAKIGERQTLELVRTPDILQTLTINKDKQIVVGFAMETHQGIERAAEKARNKNMDFICLNYPTQEGSVFGSDNNQITVVTPEGEQDVLPLMPKLEVARAILDRVVGIIDLKF